MKAKGMLGASQNIQECGGANPWSSPPLATCSTTNAGAFLDAVLQASTAPQLSHFRARCHTAIEQRRASWGGPWAEAFSRE